MGEVITPFPRRTTTVCIVNADERRDIAFEAHWLERLESVYQMERKFVNTLSGQICDNRHKARRFKKKGQKSIAPIAMERDTD